MSERRPPADPPFEPEGELDGADPTSLTRRNLLRWGALAGAVVPLGGLASAARAEAETEAEPAVTFAHHAFTVVEASIADLQEAMTKGRVTSLDLVNQYLERI